MRYLALTVTASAVASATNPCQQLCALDGSDICTGGSYPRGEFCHAYFLQPNGVHCYHNAETRLACPDSLPRLSVENAAILVAALTVEESTSSVDPTMSATTTETSTTSSSSTTERTTLRRQRVIPTAPIPASVTETPSSLVSTETSTESTTTTESATESTTQSTAPRRQRVVPVAVTSPQPDTEVATPPEVAPAAAPAAPRRRRVFPVAPSEPATEPTTAVVTPIAPVTTAPAPRRRCFPAGATLPVAATSSVVAPRSIVPSPVAPAVIPQVLVPRARSIAEDIQAIARATVSDSATTWASLGGDRILDLARPNRYECGVGYERQNACFALVLLASRLSREFVAGHTGLSQFIRENVAGLRDLLMRSAPSAIAAGRSNQYGASPVVANFAHRWIEVFPEVFQVGEALSANQAASLKAIVVRHRINHYSLIQPGFGAAQPIAPRVNRQFAFSESAQFLVADANRIRKGVSGASFEGENGMGPGVRRDWFTSVADQLYAGDFGLFERTEEAPHYTRISEFSNLDDNFRYYFRAIGRFMALSIIEGNPVGVYFPSMFYKRLIGQEVVLEDIQTDEPALFGSFNMIMRMSEEEIEYVGAPVEHSGFTEDVSATNRIAQIHSALQNIAINSKPEQFESLREGFLSAIPAEIFDGVSPSEIGSFIFGDSNISVDDLERHIQFLGYSRASPQIINLFTVLREYSQENLRKFLRFITSNTQLPLGGFGSMNPLVTVQRMARIGESGSVLLPASHTCYNTIDLPLYETLEELRERLTRAITLDSAMGII